MFDELKKKPIRDFLRPVRAFDADESLSRVVGAFSNPQTFGVIVNRDGSHGVLAASRLLRAKSADTKIATMLQPAPRIEVRATVAQAAHLFYESKLPVMPVYDGTELAGSLSPFDFLPAMRDSETGVELGISSIMSPRPESVSAQTPISKAVELMASKNIDYLPITSGPRNAKIIGVVSSRELALYALAPAGKVNAGAFGIEAHKAFSKSVRGLLAASPLTLEITETLHGALQKLVPERFDCAIVSLDDEMQGIVTPRELLRPLTAMNIRTILPFTISGLEANSAEAAIARQKLGVIGDRLSKLYGGKFRMSATVKPLRGTRKFEITLHLYSPGSESAIYTESGFDLGKIFDILERRAKEHLHRERKSRHIRTRRKSEEFQ